MGRSSAGSTSRSSAPPPPPSPARAGSDSGGAMIQSFDPLDPDSPVFWLRLGTAVLCGGIIGLERQLRGKAAGIRTSILICLGTAIFVALGASLSPGTADPTRVL